MYDLEWRTDTDGRIGRWQHFETAAALKAFATEQLAVEPALDGEVRVRCADPMGGGWAVITTARALSRWEPPAFPEELLASRWATGLAADASIGWHIQRQRALLTLAVDDGLIDSQQRDRLVEAFEQALVDKGTPVLSTTSIADRPDDIRPSSDMVR